MAKKMSEIIKSAVANQSVEEPYPVISAVSSDKTYDVKDMTLNKYRFSEVLAYSEEHGKLPDFRSDLYQTLTSAGLDTDSDEVSAGVEDYFYEMILRSEDLDNPAKSVIYNMTDSFGYGKDDSFYAILSDDMKHTFLRAVTPSIDNESMDYIKSFVGMDDDMKEKVGSRLEACREALNSIDTTSLVSQLDPEIQKRMPLYAKSISELTGFNAKCSALIAANVVLSENHLAQPQFHEGAMDCFRKTIAYTDQCQNNPETAVKIEPFTSAWEGDISLTRLDSYRKPDYVDNKPAFPHTPSIPFRSVMDKAMSGQASKEDVPATSHDERINQINSNFAFRMNRQASPHAGVEV